MTTERKEREEMQLSVKMRLQVIFNIIMSQNSPAGWLRNAESLEAAGAVAAPDIEKGSKRRFGKRKEREQKRSGDFAK
jgi:hypothetical protein